MNILPVKRVSLPTRRHARALTLVELQISLAIFVIVLFGAVVSQLYGLRMYEIVKPKLGASDEARAAVSKLIDEIRSASSIKIGDGSLSSFTEVAPNSSQIGSAIQIFPDTNTNNFIRYYWDSADNKLKRTTNGAAAMYVVANSISNQLVFTSEDYTGQPLTNNANNRVIGLTLQFYQLEYPAVSIGPGSYYDYYQLRTKITRRTLF